MIEQRDVMPPWLRLLESNQEQVVIALQSQALIVLDATARIVFANSRLAELLQRPLSDVLGAHFMEFMDGEGREYARAYLEGFPTPLTLQLELKFKRSDGHDVWVLVHRHAFAQQLGSRAQAPVAALMILTDVSALKQKERSSSAQCRELLAENQRLAELATLDPLTGLLNRRALDDRLEQETARARRHAHPLSVLLLDVDRFKLINDTFGHAEGDAALRLVATELQRHVRLSDVVARFGGEEFIVIAPHTQPAGAAVLAERLRTAVEQCPAVGRVTVSIGVAQLDLSEPAPGAAILARADRALYRAKREGRNRVCLGAEV